MPALFGDKCCVNGYTLPRIDDKLLEGDERVLGSVILLAKNELKASRVRYAHVQMITTTLRQSGTVKWD